MKKRKEKKKAAKKIQETPPPPPIEDKDDAFDFGGMPKRDLKKNLGCG